MSPLGPGKQAARQTQFCNDNLLPLTYICSHLVYTQSIPQIPARHCHCVYHHDRQPYKAIKARKRLRRRRRRPPQVSRTLSCPPPLPPPLQLQARFRPQAQHPARPFPVRAMPSPPTRASSSRSATGASPPSTITPPPPVQTQGGAGGTASAFLMRRPSWCTASSSWCGIWSSIYQAGTSPPLPLPFYYVSRLSSRSLSLTRRARDETFVSYRTSTCKRTWTKQAASIRNGLGLPLRHVE